MIERQHDEQRDSDRRKEREGDETVNECETGALSGLGCDGFVVRAVLLVGITHI